MPPLNRAGIQSITTKFKIMYKVIFFDGTSITFEASNARDAATHAQKMNWDYKLLIPA
jgi:hypothetical protein